MILMNLVGAMIQSVVMILGATMDNITPIVESEMGAEKTIERRFLILLTEFKEVRDDNFGSY